MLATMVWLKDSNPDLVSEFCLGLTVIETGWTNDNDIQLICQIVHVSHLEAEFLHSSFVEAFNLELLTTVPNSQ